MGKTTVTRLAAYFRWGLIRGLSSFQEKNKKKKLRQLTLTNIRLEQCNKNGKKIQETTEESRGIIESHLFIFLPLIGDIWKFMRFKKSIFFEYTVFLHFVHCVLHSHEFPFSDGGKKSPIVRQTSLPVRIERHEFSKRENNKRFFFSRVHSFGKCLFV